MADSTGTDNQAESEGPPTAAPVEPTAPSRWTGGRIAMIVAGSLLALIAVGALVLGAYGLWLHTTQRSDGYVMTSSERFSTGTYALATRTLHISSDVPSFLYGGDWLGDVRIRGESANPARPLFIGIAREEDVDRYLAGVAHSEVVDVNANPLGTTYRPSYRVRAGGQPATPPGRARFWVASVAGQGSRALTWRVRAGALGGCRHAARRLARGVRRPRRRRQAAGYSWGSISLLVFGMLTLAGAAALIYFGTREPRAPVPTAPDAETGPQGVS